MDRFRAAIQQYRGDAERNPLLGCIALTNPIFFRKEDWIATPADWRNSIVQGKSYGTQDAIGTMLWQQIEATTAKYLTGSPSANNNAFAVSEHSPQYGTAVLRKVRIGQGAFRLSVTDAYEKRCAITGEKTLPVLEAAHSKPYSSAGPNLTANGLLLRSDMHKLFDEGYFTITPAFKVEVSKRIRKEFNDGKEYYQYHGKALLTLPKPANSKPSALYLEYHNNNIFQT